MFDSLDEQMAADEKRAVSSTEKMVRWLLVVIVTLLIFGGLYYGVHLLEG